MEKINLLECVVAGSNGNYVPQKFIEKADTEVWGIKKENIKIIESGPEHKDYWDTWEEIVKKACWKVDGDEYVLYQDGDLFIQKVKYCDECGTLARAIYEDERLIICEDCVGLHSDKPFREVELILPKPVRDERWRGEKDRFLWKLTQSSDEKGSFIHVSSLDANFWFTIDGEDKEKAFRALKRLLDGSKCFDGYKLRILGRENIDKARLFTVIDLFVSLDSRLTLNDRGTVANEVHDKFIKHTEKDKPFSVIDIVDRNFADGYYHLSDSDHSRIGIGVENLPKKIELFLSSDSSDVIKEKWNEPVIAEYIEAIEYLLFQAYVESNEKNGGEK